MNPLAAPVAALPVRLKALVELCPDVHPIVDVGADHGYVAHSLGAIAVERLPQRRGRVNVRWVVADGLAPFRNVGTAIIAGMGADKIIGILAKASRPQALVLHAQDDPGRLRQALTRDGWRIDAERLVPEARGFATVLRALPGVEPSAGWWLFFGPRLLVDGDPLRRDWLTQERATRQRWLSELPEQATTRRAEVAEQLAFLDARLADPLP